MVSCLWPYVFTGLIAHLRCFLTKTHVQNHSRVSYWGCSESYTFYRRWHLRALICFHLIPQIEGCLIEQQGYITRGCICSSESGPSFLRSACIVDRREGSCADGQCHLRCSCCGRRCEWCGLCCNRQCSYGGALSNETLFHGFLHQLPFPRNQIFCMTHMHAIHVHGVKMWSFLNYDLENLAGRLFERAHIEASQLIVSNDAVFAHRNHTGPFLVQPDTLWHRMCCGAITYCTVYIPSSPPSLLPHTTMYPTVTTLPPPTHNYVSHCHPPPSSHTQHTYPISISRSVKPWEEWPEWSLSYSPVRIQPWEGAL